MAFFAKKSDFGILGGMAPWAPKAAYVRVHVNLYHRNSIRESIWASVCHMNGSVNNGANYNRLGF